MREKIEVPVALFMKMGLGPNRTEEDGKEFDKLVTLAQVPNLSIVGKQHWHRRTGNTYYTVFIYANGEEIIGMGPFNGYGDQYLYTALGWLRANKPDWVQGWDNRSAATIYLRDAQIEYSMTDVKKERDL